MKTTPPASRPFAQLGRMLLLSGSATLLLAGCVSTQPEVGGGSKSAVTGAAGGATTANANSSLEKCDQSLGTLAVVEDQNATWYQYLRNYKLGSTVPVIRMMIQQSNCFVVVERGAAMNNMNTERALRDSGEMRNNSNFGKGQMVAADYTMSPSIQFSQNTGGMGGALGGFSGGLGILGAVAGGLKTNEAATTLIMIDNRSGVQLAAAEGTAKNTDFNLMGGLFGGAIGGGASGYANSPEGKIIIAAFADSYNQLVKAVRNYQAQTVKGGLGTGGTLGVQGGSTAASQEVDAAAKPAPASTRKPAPVKKATTPASK
ncbi:CsgG/HfaB family protein [Aquincola tertiaricarbonis]|uniref:CsgG/HfaB family protein n=1 Tax=Aquincola tertiaricarbonis TaxID=391953 RepID=A0ABY4S543_AQUTE|nr:CsgG/HfaB family protein [Aquincola tertiaricarbonis]URI08119.1 CsgG/HfaB family protein [Aquincola tertiaricarbonis]